MTTNDDLDDFFKKKDRKGNKHKKQTGLLTNNEELLKQLVIVTSATSAFKENMDFDEDEDEQPIHDESVIGTGLTDDKHKNPTQHHKTKISDDNKYLNGQPINNSEGGSGQPDEWEEFVESNSKYEQLRLKFGSKVNDDDNDDEYYDDENNPHHNDDNNEKHIDREQQKDKPVWKINQVKQDTETILPRVEEKIEEPTPPPPKPSTTSGVYRPPQMRSSGGGGTSVTVVSGVSHRPTKKKEQPNLASTDDFPTLGSTVNKK